MERSAVSIGNAWDAAFYSIVGFSIAFFVLAIVVLAVVLISKLEYFILKYRIESTKETPITAVEVLDPMIIAAITAAVYEFNRRMLVKSVYLIGHDVRHPQGWGTRGTSKSKYR